MARLLDGAPVVVLGTLEREYGLCKYLLPDRLRLPRVPAGELLPDYDSHGVMVDTLPSHGWETGVHDAVAVAKLVAATGACRVLELGSYSGATARLAAGELPDDGVWVAVDVLDDHGWAYRGGPVENRIQRRVGRIGTDMLRDDPPYDLVFIDADHRYDAVAHDTAVAREFLAPDGWILWHDYANWGRFSRACGVPEFLHDLSRDLPIVHFEGTAIAAHNATWLDAPPFDALPDAASTSAAR